jgi:hypothetical protein
MYIDVDKLIQVLKKVSVVREHLRKHCPEPQMPVLGIMNLHWAIQDIYGLNIEMLEVSFEADHLRGKVERYSDNRARVLVRLEQTYQEKRLVTTKELCHLMNDEKDDWSTLGVETISGLLMEWTLQKHNGVGHEQPSDSLQSEILAEIAAIELMYPSEFRDADIEKLELGQTTVTQISLEHELPAYSVEQALRHHPMLKEHWQSIYETLR